MTLDSIVNKLSHGINAFLVHYIVINYNLQFILGESYGYN